MELYEGQLGTATGSVPPQDRVGTCCANPQDAEDAEEAVCAVNLCGLAFTSSCEDVLALFAEHGLSECVADGANSVTLLRNRDGRPSGQAVVQLRRPMDVQDVVRALDRETFRLRDVWPAVVPFAAGLDLQPGSLPTAEREGRHAVSTA
jgi:hypothetical protein